MEYEPRLRPYLSHARSQEDPRCNRNEYNFCDNIYSLWNDGIYDYSCSCSLPPLQILLGKRAWPIQTDLPPLPHSELRTKMPAPIRGLLIIIRHHRRQHLVQRLAGQGRKSCSSSRSASACTALCVVALDAPFAKITFASPFFSGARTHFEERYRDQSP